LLILTACIYAADKYSPPGGNSLADELQWLTVQTACAGMYNMAQTGDYSIGDPRDYYTPTDIREYLARQSGSRTATATFYGICFDYAQAAYNYISDNRAFYEGKGMKKNGWYIVGTGNNSRQITLYDPSSQAQATVRMNGVYIRENSRQNVQAHGNAAIHAWLWVYCNDGTIYWIDPTWTDTGGYTWWGVVENGREVQRNSSQRLSAITLPGTESRRGSEVLALFNSGTANLKQKRYDQAITDYTAVLRINADYALAYNNRGIAYHNKGDYNRAVADYTAALRLDPNSAALYTNRGIAYNAKKDYNRAIADFSAALRIDPLDVVALHDRALAYFDTGGYDRAIADCTAALRIRPNDVDTYFLRAATYSVKEDYDRVIADCTAVLRIDPKNALAYSSRGSAYESKGDILQAVGDYADALQIDPYDMLTGISFKTACREGAKICEDSGNYDGAIAYYDFAVLFFPNSAHDYLLRGSAYNKKGDYTRARADYTKVLQIEPGNEAARLGLEWLNKAGR
jgi:tetratricopeptide (TPR) repeat protein